LSFWKRCSRRAQQQQEQHKQNGLSTEGYKAQLECGDKNKARNVLMYVIDLLAVLERDQQNTNAMLTYIYKES
jgi:hypothetical protein